MQKMNKPGNFKCIFCLLMWTMNEIKIKNHFGQSRYVGIKWLHYNICYFFIQSKVKYFIQALVLSYNH